MAGEVIHSDVLPGLQSLPAETFHCAVTSPPYWQLRQYAGVGPTLPPVPCRVLDPFAGTGTSLRVAKHLGRDWVGIEASADYLPIIEANLERPLPSKDAKAKKPKPKRPARQEPLLF